MEWDYESEERLAPGLRRALRAADESEREPVAVAAAEPAASVGLDWAAEYEGPVRGRLRRALLAVD